MSPRPTPKQCIFYLLLGRHTYCYLVLINYHNITHKVSDLLDNNYSVLRRYNNQDFHGRNWSVPIRMDLILSVREVTHSIFKRYVPTLIGFRLRY